MLDIGGFLWQYGVWFYETINLLQGVETMMVKKDWNNVRIEIYQDMFKRVMEIEEEKGEDDYDYSMQLAIRKVMYKWWIADALTEKDFTLAKECIKDSNDFDGVYKYVFFVTGYQRYPSTPPELHTIRDIRGHSELIVVGIQQGYYLW